MSLSSEKRQLRNEHLILEGLIYRYGNITLLDAHDFVSVALDYFRGAGIKRKRKNDVSKKELLSWMDETLDRE